MRSWFRTCIAVVASACAYGLLRGGPEGIPGVARLCLAVLALVAALVVWGRRARPKVGLARTPRMPAWRDYAAVGAAFLAMECVLLVFFSLVPAPLERVAGEVEVWLRPGRAEAPDERGAAAGGGNWLWSEGTSRPLPKRADFKPGNRPEIFLRPEDAEAVLEMMARRMYVHSFALERYEAGVWSMPPGREKPLRAGPDGWLRLGQRPGVPRVVRVFHGSSFAPEQPVAGLQGIVGVEMPELRERGEGLHLLPAPQEGEDGYEYRVASQPWSLEDLPVAAVAGTAAHSGLLALPPGPTGDRLADYARGAAGQGGMVPRLERLRERLRRDFAYSLRIANAADLDPLENFLFHEKRGHCELFATAGALMARSLGVPARVVYGWSGGTYFEGGNLFVFRAREAHAWAEVLVDGVGWTVFDPTPPGALERELATVAPPGEPLPSVADEVARVDEEGATAPESPRLPLLVAGALLLPALAVVVRRMSRRPDPDAIGPCGGPAGSYLAALRRAWRRHGRPVPRGRTLRGHLLEQGDGPDFAAEAVRYHYAVRYEGAARNPALEKALARKAEEWR